MFVSRPSIPYFGLGSYYQPPQAAAAAPPGVQGIAQAPQIPPQQGAVPGFQSTAFPFPHPGLIPPPAQNPQLNPQLLARLAQLRGFGLGGFSPQQQQPFGLGRGIQPIQTGAYSLR